jgi:hypothetical protein
VAFVLILSVIAFVAMLSIEIMRSMRHARAIQSVKTVQKARRRSQVTLGDLSALRASETDVSDGTNSNSSNGNVSSAQDAKSSVDDSMGDTLHASVASDTAGSHSKCAGSNRRASSQQLLTFTSNPLVDRDFAALSANPLRMQVVLVPPPPLDTESATNLSSLIAGNVARHAGRTHVSLAARVQAVKKCSVALTSHRGGRSSTSDTSHQDH